MNNENFNQGVPSGPTNNNQKKATTWNILVVIFNLIMVLVNKSNGYISYYSIIILIFNLIISILAIKNNEKKTSQIICLVIEIITAIIMIL